MRRLYQTAAVRWLMFQVAARDPSMADVLPVEARVLERSEGSFAGGFLAGMLVGFVGGVLAVGLILATLLSGRS